jgi:hypothetical protein
MARCAGASRQAMQIARWFSAYLKDLSQQHGRDDLALVERSWDELGELYSRVLNQVAPVLSFAADRQAKPLTQWRQVAEVVAYDLAASKRLLDEGFLLQAPAMLRVAMETGCSLTTLTWSNKLPQWLAGERIDVQWRERNGLRTRRIDDCSYGQLRNALKLLVDRTKAFDDSQLIAIVEDLEAVHELFHATLGANKYIHKSRELVNQTRWLFSRILEQAQHGSKKGEVREGLLDMRFEFHVTLDRSLYNQVISRFIELCRLIECEGVGLPQSERDGFKALATELVAAGERFENAVRPYWAAWASRHGEEVN